MTRHKFHTPSKLIWSKFTMKKAPFLRTPYNYDMNEAGNEDAIRCKEPTLTQQHHAEEADINTIIRRFNVTGELPQSVRMPTFGDFEGIFDYHQAMNAIREADESFMAMPAETRARFNNNAASFVEFCSDPRNRDEAAKMGLLVPPAPPAEPPPSLKGSSPPEPPKTDTK